MIGVGGYSADVVSDLISVLIGELVPTKPGDVLRLRKAECSGELVGVFRQLMGGKIVPNCVKIVRRDLVIAFDWIIRRGYRCPSAYAFSG